MRSVLLPGSLILIVPPTTKGQPIPPGTTCTVPVRYGFDSSEIWSHYKIVTLKSKSDIDKIIMGKPICAILGAGVGLGQSLARAFAKEGYEIAVLSRSESGSEAALAAAKQAGSENAAFFAADFTDSESLTSALEKITSDLGKISTLIYNARDGLVFKDPLAATAEELRHSFETEVVGAHTAALAVVPGMIEDGTGTFIVSSATAALRGSANRAAYSTAKFALRGWAQCMAKAYAKKGVHFVHVRLDCGMDVPFVRQLLGDSFKPENFANPDAVAESYVAVSKQPKSAWSNEIEIRPYTEDWTY
jgi:NAD(P)-dependent dehydrogenase (short-subunit alcohol dehydrogenase family)